MSDLIACEPHAFDVQLTEVLYETSVSLSIEAPETRMICENDASHGFEVRPFEGWDERGVRKRALENALRQRPEAAFASNTDAVHECDPPRDAFRRFPPACDGFDKRAD